MLRQEPWSGVWVPIVTPFRNDSLALDLVPALVGRLVETGVHGIVALGTTGEAPHVTDEEAPQVVQSIVRAAAGRVPVVAGSGRPSTQATIELGARLVDAGADGLLVLTPYAYRPRMDRASLRRHYERIAAAIRVPVFVYHLPDVTGLDLESDLLVDLLGLENILGFKDSSTQGGPLAAALRDGAGRGFVGSGERVLEGLQAGAAGGILAIANVVPELCVALYEAFRSGDLERAASFQERAAVCTRLLRPHGVPGIKAALEGMGFPAGEVRAPLAMPHPEATKTLVAALSAALRGAS